MPKIFQTVIRRTVASGGAPVGGAEGLLVRDSLGALQVAVGTVEALATPTDVGRADLTTTRAETQATQDDSYIRLEGRVNEAEFLATPQEMYALALRALEANAAPSETVVRFDLRGFTETQATPTESQRSDITALSLESNATPTEAVKAAIVAPAETQATPTEVQLSTLAYLATESQPAPTETHRATIAGLVETQATPTETQRSDLTYRASEANAAPTETAQSLRASGYVETNAAPTESHKAAVSGAGLGETNAAPGEARATQLRCWASTTSDNDQGRTTPANVNGQNNATRATVRTNLAALDVTNPVVLTTTVFGGVPSTGTFTAKRLRIWFNVGARTTQNDTIAIEYTVNGTTWISVYAHAGTAAVNHDAGTYTVDISARTLAECAALDMRCSYTAAVVASPESVVNLDAWCLEFDGGI